MLLLHKLQSADKENCKTECGFTAAGPTTHFTPNICCTHEPCQRDIVTIIMSVLYQVLKD